MARTRTASRLGIRAAVVLLLAGCHEITQPPAAAVTVRSVSVDTASDGGVLLRVELSEPTTVRVEYWSDPTHKLRVDTPVLSAEGTLHIAALRASQRYHFEAAALDASGTVGAAYRGEFDTPAMPGDLEDVQFTARGHSSAPLTMLEINGPFKGFVAVDETGAPVWWWRTQGTPQGFTRRTNGNFVFIDVGYGLVEIRPDGQVVNRLPPLPNGDRAPHHDVVATPTNTLLFLAQEPRTIGSGTVVGDAIWEWTPETNELVKRWSVFDFYDSVVDVGTRTVPWDWVHANSLAIGDHGNVVLSLNWLDQVISIAPDWRSIEWKAGGRGSSFKPDPDAMFQGQHTAELLPNGHLLMFDNGRDRSAPDRFSRGLELVLDAKTGTAHRAWSFRASPDIYAPYVGATRRLLNGNTLTMFGLSAGFAGVASGPIACYEVTANGTVAWSLIVDNVNVVYRATPLASIAGETAVQ